MTPDPDVPADGGPAIAAFWSAIDLSRPLVLAYVAYQYASRLDEVQHPGRGWLILAVLALWTVLTLLLRRRTAGWLAAELALSAAAIVASAVVDSPEVIASGAPTVPGMWVAGTVLYWAALAGPVGGTGAALVIAVADLVLIGTPSQGTMHNIVILVLLGSLIGYSADLARSGQRAVRGAALVQARALERERLARSVHDGVLQALSYVHRRGLELGGESAELGRVAAEQERNLRELIRVPVIGTSRGAGGADDETDLATLLAARTQEDVAVVDTGDEVILPTERAQAIDAAVAAALDNVRRHAGPGARAWVLLERVENEVLVTVRDNGVGMAPGRLAQARAEGRLGVCSSIVGRMEELGGSATITSSDGGTRVELRAAVKAGDGRGDGR